MWGRRSDRSGSCARSALDYAHARGLIHRDIKPENILLQSGHAAVTDFGIARGMGEGHDTRLTQTGVAVGTVAYMSPEQASGETDLDARTDVYALGCVLYEMLEGVTPFAGHTPQAILAKKLTGAVPEFSADTSVPGTVAAVVRKALAAEPESRYTTPADLAENLEMAITVEAIEGAAARRRSARRLRVLGALAGVALLGFGGVWITTFLSGPAIERVAVLPLTNGMNDPRVSPEVQEALWQARFHRNELSEESLSLALDYYQLAPSRDPDTALHDRDDAARQVGARRPQPDRAGTK